MNKVSRNSIIANFQQRYNRDNLSAMAYKERFNRGLELFYRGDVTDIDYDHNTISAICHSQTDWAKQYNVTFIYNGYRWDVYCNCPDESTGWCKHQIAVGMVILEHYKVESLPEYNGMVTYEGVPMQAKDVRVLNRMKHEIRCRASNAQERADLDYVESVFLERAKLENERTQKQGIVIVLIR